MTRHWIIAAILGVGGTLAPALVVAAQLAICATEVGLRIAHGQLSDHGWKTQGWITVDAGDCQVLSITRDKPIDLRLLALRSDGSGPVLTPRLAGTDPSDDPTYMRDEELVCGAKTDFESIGTVIFTLQACPDGQERMVLPIRVTVPADRSYRLSF